jgi:GntR family transcriptional regulator/MocR family aminotransferase
MEAYAQLAAEGYLVSRQGAPTRVAARAATTTTTALPDEPPAPRFDFRPGAPDVALFPRTAWATALRQALRDAPDARFSYSDPRGTPELRIALATYLGRGRGVAAEPATIMVTSGLTQGLVLTCRALAARGVRRIGVEEPGSADLRGPIATVGLQWVPVPVDGDGLDVDALDRSHVGAVLVTPAHQYPTGVVLAPQRRAALLAWAAARDAYVLEDDYDAEYRYDRQPVGALQGLDPRRVAYMSSISKTVAPALRIGWLVAPPALAPAIEREKLDDDRGTPVLTQLGLAVLMARGELDRHVRSSRLVYRRRRDALIAALARHLPQLSPHGAAAGLHLLVDLPADVDESAVVSAAEARGVGLDSLAPHTARPHPPAVILGYGRVAEPAIEPGVRALAAAVRAVTPS